MIKKSTKTDRILLDEIHAPLPEKAASSKPDRLFGEKLARNLALAGMMLLTLVSVRSEKLPSGQTVSAAVHQLIDPDWEERLGKISFVGSFLPESVAVFFETGEDAAMLSPCFGEITHRWTRDEPYLVFSSADPRVFSPSKGEVMSVSHDVDDHTILRVRHDNGYETLYYGLSDVRVREGDPVTAQTCLGAFDPAHAAFETRRYGLPIDPSGMLSQRSGEK